MKREKFLGLILRCMVMGIFFGFINTGNTILDFVILIVIGIILAFLEDVLFSGKKRGK